MFLSGLCRRDILLWILPVQEKYDVEGSIAFHVEKEQGVIRSGLICASSVEL